MYFKMTGRFDHFASAKIFFLSDISWNFHSHDHRLICSGFSWCSLFSSFPIHSCILFNWNVESDDDEKVVTNSKVKWHNIHSTVVKIASSWPLNLKFIKTKSCCYLWIESDLFFSFQHWPIGLVMAGMVACSLCYWSYSILFIIDELFFQRVY